MKANKIAVIIAVLFAVVVLVLGWFYLKKVMIDFDGKISASASVTHIDTENFAWNQTNTRIELS